VAAPGIPPPGGSHLSSFVIATPARGLLEITDPVRARVRDSGIRSGLATLFLRHTSASLLVQDNADPDVRDDLERFFARLVRDGDALFVIGASGEAARDPGKPSS
jgi:secondary thiamine-phosphate synthase enzyme